MARFPETQWSLVRRSGESPSAQGTAFSELVRAYQPAILAYFRARLPKADAEDATQSFLADSFEHRWWARADAATGSFRGFLRMLLRRHLGHVRARAGRPAGDPDPEVEAIADPLPGAERAFDVRFALLLTQRALARLQADYASRGRGAIFGSMAALLREPPAHGELQAQALALGMAPNTLAVELRRLRARLREAMRAELGQLCIDQATLDREWGELEAVLAGR